MRAYVCVSFLLFHNRWNIQTSDSRIVFFVFHSINIRTHSLSLATHLIHMKITCGVCTNAAFGSLLINCRYFNTDRGAFVYKHFLRSWTPTTFSCRIHVYIGKKLERVRERLRFIKLAMNCLYANTHTSTHNLIKISITSIFVQSHKISRTFLWLPIDYTNNMMSMMPRASDR